MVNGLLKVSVVMSVFDNPDEVSKTIESVLRQQGVQLDFVIVDDGADNEVKQCLAQYHDHHRIRVFEQSNQGLTKALIKGCDEANHDLIARIDSGDVMLQGRLYEQARLLQQNNAIGIVTSWVSVVTEEGYELYQLTPSAAELQQGLSADNADQFVSPFHASVMFRKSLYQQVGGYRQEFYFTQDCDLWSRMIEHSDIAVIEKIMTQGVFSPSGISGRYIEQQKVLKQLVVAAKQCRQQGRSEHQILSEASRYKKQNNTSDNPFDALYFLAKCLYDNRSEHAKEYFWRAIKVKPYSIKSWLFLISSFWVSQ